MSLLTMGEKIKKSFIIDASYALSYLLQEEIEVNTIFEQFAENEITLIASPLLVFEVGNGLRSAVLRKRLEKKSALLLFKSFLQLHIQYTTVDAHEVLALSIKNTLSFYDASYVFLAKKHGLPLLTLDTKLQQNYKSKYGF